MSAESLNNSDDQFYNNAAKYWSDVPPTVDGMLGGFGYISQTDIKSSKMLLKHLFNAKDPPGKEYALDCGAGIGRISKFLLTDFFEKVDMVEQNKDFLETAKIYLGPKISKIANFYPIGLQNFKPEPEKYDVIWIQWVIGHLTNKDVIPFLIACRKGLKKNGVIVLKENITSTDGIEKDELDSSITRPMFMFHQLFEKAKLSCYRQLKQHNFPKGLYSIYMFVLRPFENHLHDNSGEENLRNGICANRRESNNLTDLNFSSNTNTDITYNNCNF
ncbi:N-terminal Xaa-Pro-Lys N-methyltransferase 1 [Diorhabda sublineata]|uniref:N-terminal Xaa-Pro-Lys N-methyltransferase 1 n=1 Tax=Diorhabda sublineata TaxID=1163346 RepID=UPI0024E13F1B|nr:N-terminal Xaa-Pro-Lys N-methyltransferase 1 [Diorhabda sublineata]